MLVTVQPSCVQVAVSAVTAASPVRARRKLPSELRVVANPPTVASAPDVRDTEIVLPETDPDTDVSGVPELEGDVGLPPQAATPPNAIRAADRAQQAQNSRRPGICGSLCSLTVSPHQVKKIKPEKLFSREPCTAARNSLAIHRVDRHS